MRSRSAGLACVLLLGPVWSRGQTTGTVDGRVTSSLGTPIAGVHVEAMSPRLQGSRSAMTDATGAFRFSSLPPGKYTIQASLAGYRPIETAAVVALDARVALELVLEPSTAEDVVVRGQAPQIDASSTTGGTSYSASVISFLPVSRNYADIVRSNPGVGTDRGDTQGGRSLALTIYGSTSSENQWLIDGLNTTNVIRGIQGKTINNEFIEEVQVKTGGYPVEYGGATGGIVNVVTKSGGNTFHGDGFVYYDSSATTADVFVDEEEDSSFAETTSLGRGVDFGADLGGYLLKDRLWFYLAYNRVEARYEIARVDPQGEVTPDDKFPLDTTDDLFSAKLTWNAALSTSVVATVFADPSTTSGAEGGAPVSLEPTTWFTGRDVGGTDYGGRLTQLLGAQAIVTIQGGVHHDRYELDGADLVRTEDWRCGVHPDPEQNCPPYVPNSVTGGFGGAAGRYDHNASTREQYRADATFYTGSHELKAGAVDQNGETQGVSFYSGGQQVGIYNDQDPSQTYYAHDYVAVSEANPTAVPDYRPAGRTIGISAYASDSWRASSDLTIYAGLRWDGEEVQDFQGMTRLRSRDQWQPRLGVVWMPGTGATTKISAFAGRFAYDLPTIPAIAAFHGYTILESYNFDPVGLTPDPTVIGHENNNPSLVQGGGIIGDAVDAGVGLTYQDELTLGVEHAFDPTLTVGLKGTYRRLGRAIEDRCDFETTGFYNNCALINPGSGQRYAAGRAPACNGLDDKWHQCFETGPPTPLAKRTYRGIELVARKSVGQSFWAQASYVYSSLLGNFDGAVSSDGNTDIGNGSDFNYPELWHNGYGTLALDRTHRFRLDGFWSSPWQLVVGLQFFVETGAPLDRLGYFNADYGAAIRLVPRGSAGRLPPLWEANLTLGYPISLGPVTMTLQAYLFNVFNNQIATATDMAWTIDPTPNYPNDIEDSHQRKSNENYGKVTERYAPRSFRAAVRISF